VCSSDLTSVTKPWAPRLEWRAGGVPSGVPILQDEYSASGPSLAGLNKFVFNHGRGTSRTNNEGIPAYTNYPTSPSRAGCLGANVGYLDGHVSWVKNARIGATAKWTLDVPWSGSALRLGGGPSTSGVPLTVSVRTLKP